MNITSNSRLFLPFVRLSNFKMIDSDLEWDTSFVPFITAINTCQKETVNNSEIVHCIRVYKNIVFAGLENSKIRSWSLKNSKQEFKGHEKPVLCLDITADLLVSGSEDYTLHNQAMGPYHIKCVVYYQSPLRKCVRS